MLVKSKRKAAVAIVVGCGDIGMGMARKMTADGYDVKVIDKDPRALERLGDDYAGSTVVGDAGDIDALGQCGLHEAQLLVAVTDNDNLNLMIAQISRVVFQVPEVIASVSGPHLPAFDMEPGIRVIHPQQIICDSISAMIDKGRAREYI